MTYPDWTPNAPKGAGSRVWVYRGGGYATTADVHTHLPAEIQATDALAIDPMEAGSAGYPDGAAGDGSESQSQ